MPNLLNNPQSFKEFVGQKNIKQTLNIMIKSAQQQKINLDHILLYGKPGFGKTSLAKIIAKKFHSKLRFAQGTSLEKKSDILALFSSLSKNDIIFIDEIHSINKNVEELIYSILEENVLDFILGKDGDSKIIRITLPSFTLIGATTKLNLLSLPLRERFGIICKFINYQEQDLFDILINSCQKINWKYENNAIHLIVSYAHNTPRIAKNLLKRVIDFAIVKKKNVIDELIVKKTFLTIGLYKFGFTDSHINYLKCLYEKFAQKFVSITHLSSYLVEESQIIAQDIEPILLVKKFIIKNSQGRKITKNGINYLKTIKCI